MVSSAWWREAGTASDWLALPHNGSDARNRNQNLSHFEAEMFADCDDLHLDGDSQGSRRLIGPCLLFTVQRVLQLYASALSGRERSGEPGAQNLRRGEQLWYISPDPRLRDNWRSHSE